jgi:hypothetical protein
VAPLKNTAYRNQIVSNTAIPKSDRNNDPAKEIDRSPALVESPSREHGHRQSPYRLMYVKIVRRVVLNFP